MLPGWDPRLKDPESVAFAILNVLADLESEGKLKNLPKSKKFNPPPQTILQPVPQRRAALRQKILRRYYSTLHNWEKKLNLEELTNHLEKTSEITLRRHSSGLHKKDRIEVQAITRILPEGSGNFYADGAYDSKKVLNTVAEKGYRPIVKRTKNPPDGFGSKKRDEVFSVEEYKHRNPHEGFWSAFATWFGDRMPCFLGETAVARLGGNVLRAENPSQIPLKQQEMKLNTPRLDGN